MDYGFRLCILWQIVGADFDIIDQYVCVVDRSRELIRELHFTINNKFNMVSSGRKLEDC